MPNPTTCAKCGIPSMHDCATYGNETDCLRRQLSHDRVLMLEAAIEAYCCGYESGHHDTVEAQFWGNGNPSAHAEIAEEWWTENGDDLITRLRAALVPRKSGKVTYPKFEGCEDCGGKGTLPLSTIHYGGDNSCPACHGSGFRAAAEGENDE